jgi:cytochrome c peroxidase
MHDGRFKNLKEVLAHYGRVFQIDANQQKDIIAFLKTLTDTNFITNPKYQFHQIQTLP